MDYIVTTKNLRSLHEAAYAYGFSEDDGEYDDRIKMRLITDLDYQTVMLEINGSVFAAPCHDSLKPTRVVDFYLTVDELEDLLEVEQPESNDKRTPRQKSTLEKLYTKLKFTKRNLARNVFRPAWEKVKSFWNKTFSLGPLQKRKSTKSIYSGRGSYYGSQPQYRFKQGLVQPAEEPTAIRPTVQSDIIKLQTDQGEQEARKVQDLMRQLAAFKSKDAEVSSTLRDVASKLNSLVWLHDIVEFGRDDELGEEAKRLQQVGKQAGWSVVAAPGVQTKMVRIEPASEPWTLIAKRHPGSGG